MLWTLKRAAASPSSSGPRLAGSKDMTTKSYAKQLAKMLEGYYAPVEDAEAYWGAVVDTEADGGEDGLADGDKYAAAAAGTKGTRTRRQDRTGQWR